MALAFKNSTRKSEKDKRCNRLFRQKNRAQLQAWIDDAQEMYEDISAQVNECALYKDFSDATYIPLKQCFDRYVQEFEESLMLIEHQDLGHDFIEDMKTLTVNLKIIREMFQSMKNMYDSGTLPHQIKV